MLHWEPCQVPTRTNDGMGARRGGTCPPPWKLKNMGPPPQDNLTRKKNFSEETELRAPHLVSKETDLRGPPIVSKETDLRGPHIVCEVTYLRGPTHSKRSN